MNCGGMMDAFLCVVGGFMLRSFELLVDGTVGQENGT